jgi:RNA-binding protein
MLSSDVKRKLKARAHALKPVVLLGQQGLSAPVLNEVTIALEYHELIKVKLPQIEREVRAKITEEILAKTGAALVQSMGRIITLYKKNPNK